MWKKKKFKLAKDRALRLRNAAVIYSFIYLSKSYELSCDETNHLHLKGSALPYKLWRHTADVWGSGGRWKHRLREGESELEFLGRTLVPFWVVVIGQDHVSATLTPHRRSRVCSCRVREHFQHFPT